MMFIALLHLSELLFPFYIFMSFRVNTITSPSDNTFNSNADDGTEFHNGQSEKIDSNRSSETKDDFDQHGAGPNTPNNDFGFGLAGVGSRSRGRPKLIGDELGLLFCVFIVIVICVVSDASLIDYLLDLRARSTERWTANTVLAISTDYVRRTAPGLLAQDGGHVVLRHTWATTVMQRAAEIQRARMLRAKNEVNEDGMWFIFLILTFILVLLQMHRRTVYLRKRRRYDMQITQRQIWH